MVHCVGEKSFPSWTLICSLCIWSSSLAKADTILLLLTSLCKVQFEFITSALASELEFAPRFVSELAVKSTFSLQLTFVSLVDCIPTRSSLEAKHDLQSSPLSLFVSELSCILPLGTGVHNFEAQYFPWGNKILWSSCVFFIVLLEVNSFNAIKKSPVLKRTVSLIFRFMEGLNKGKGCKRSYLKWTTKECFKHSSVLSPRDKFLQIAHGFQVGPAQTVT